MNQEKKKKKVFVKQHYSLLTSAYFTNCATFFRLLEERKKPSKNTHKTSNISTEKHWESKHSSDYKCIHRGFNSKTNMKNKVKCYSSSRIATDITCLHTITQKI